MLTEQQTLLFKNGLNHFIDEVIENCRKKGNWPDDEREIFNQILEEKEEFILAKKEGESEIRVQNEWADRMLVNLIYGIFMEWDIPKILLNRHDHNTKRPERHKKDCHRFQCTRCGHKIKLFGDDPVPSKCSDCGMLKAYESIR